MLESLPSPTQERAVEHLRQYIEDLKDEARWDAQFEKTTGKLSEMANQARREIADGKSLPMDFEKL